MQEAEQAALTEAATKLKAQIDWSRHPYLAPIFKHRPVRVEAESVPISQMNALSIPARESAKLYLYGELMSYQGKIYRQCMASRGTTAVVAPDVHFERAVTGETVDDGSCTWICMWRPTKRTVKLWLVEDGESRGG